MEGMRKDCYRFVVSRVLEFCHPCRVSVPFTGPSLVEMKFDRKIFPPVSVFGGVSELHVTLKYHLFCLDIILQTKAFIASNRVLSAIHLQIRYHTADEHVYR